MAVKEKRKTDFKISLRLYAGIRSVGKNANSQLNGIKKIKGREEQGSICRHRSYK